MTEENPTQAAPPAGEARKKRQYRRRAAPREAAGEQPREAQDVRRDSLGRVIREIPKDVVREDHDSADRFKVDPKLVPEGWSWEYKRESTFGKVDTRHQANLRANGWNPVPDDQLPPGVEARIDGMLLMERPMYATKQAEHAAYMKARGEVERVRDIIDGTPEGTLTRNHQSVKRVSGVSVERDLSIPYDPGKGVQRG